MNQTTKRVLVFLLAGMLLLAACAPAPAAPVTQDPAQVQQQIQESVALTMAAQNAQTEEARASIPEPTNTPLPTQTEVVVLPTQTDLPLPTATPFVVVAPTLAPSTGSGSGGGSVVVPVTREYACNIINQKPSDNSKWKQNKDFDVTWTLINTGTKAWRAGSDLVFYSGTNFAKTTFVELPAVAPGEQYKVVLDAVAPSKAGSYVMVWKLEGGFCLPALVINVE